MANNLSVLNPKKWEPYVQDYLNNMLIAMEVARTKFSVDIQRSGQEIEFPTLSDVYLEDYIPGTDLTEQPMTAVSSVLTIDQKKGVLVNIDDMERAQAEADYQLAMSKQMAYQLRNNMDGTLITTGVNTAALSAVGGTLNGSSMYQAMLDADTSLFQANAYTTGMQKFAIMGPQFKNLLASTFVANGFQVADSTLRNGFEGFAHGFDVYCSNNIPSSVPFTLAVNPTPGDTITIWGVTWTYVAAAANPGEITIAGGVAGTQTNTINAIAGTGTGFVDVSSDNRTVLKNQRAVLSAFVADVATLSGLGKINASSSFASASNLFGTETTSILFGVKGAIALAAQIMPTLETTPKPKQFGVYLKGKELYGTKVFSRDARRLYKLTVNA